MKKVHIIYGAPLGYATSELLDKLEATEPGFPKDGGFTVLGRNAAGYRVGFCGTLLALLTEEEYAAGVGRVTYAPNSDQLIAAWRLTPALDKRVLETCPKNTVRVIVEP